MFDWTPEIEKRINDLEAQNAKLEHDKQALLEELQDCNNAVRNREEDISKLRAALRHFVNLHHGVSKDGSRDISSEEWHEAISTGQDLITETEKP